MCTSEVSENFVRIPSFCMVPTHQRIVFFLWDKLKLEAWNVSSEMIVSENFVRIPSFCMVPTHHRIAFFLRDKLK
jgi:hypothetical protein